MVASRGDRKLVNIVRFYLKEVKPFKVKVDAQKFLKMGLKGKELGEAIEKEKARILDEALGERFTQLAPKS